MTLTTPTRQSRAVRELAIGFGGSIRRTKERPALGGVAKADWMGGDFIPVAVREFLVSRIDSIAQLEALLLLYRDPSRSWDAAGVAARLYIGEGQAHELLKRLASDGLLADDGPAYHFRCETPVADTVRLVSEHYAKHLIPVTNLIHAKSYRITEFADAFRIKKEG